METLRSALAASPARAASVSTVEKVHGLSTDCRERIFNYLRQVRATLFGAGYYPKALSVIATMRGQLRGKRQ